VSVTLRASTLLFGLALAASPLAPLRAQQVYDGCGMEGDATAPSARALNILKNRYTAPAPADLDSQVTLAALVAPGDDRARWDERHGASIVGYVHDVKPGGIETTNCRARDLPERDTHIELVLDPMDATGPRRVIVEVTPRWRAMLAANGVDWSTAALRKFYLGRWVRVTGWLLFDAEHANAAENTAPGNARNWRATAWEVHPITAIEVVPRPR
jgi:hypothetical protein